MLDTIEKCDAEVERFGYWSAHNRGLDLIVPDFTPSVVYKSLITPYYIANIRRKDYFPFHLMEDDPFDLMYFKLENVTNTVELVDVQQIISEQKHVNASYVFALANNDFSKVEHTIGSAMLPFIRLLKYNNVYCIHDGNNRVTAARMSGHRYIYAVIAEVK